MLSIFPVRQPVALRWLSNCGFFLLLVLPLSLFGGDDGHPGTLLGTSTLTSVKAGAWNSVAIAPQPITAGKPYWIALLGTNGVVRFRDNMGTAGTAMETSASKALTTLPSTWKTGTVYPEGPASAFGAGY